MYIVTCIYGEDMGAMLVHRLHRHSPKRGGRVHFVKIRN